MPVFDAADMHFPVVYPQPRLLAQLTAGSGMTTPDKVRQVMGELVFPAPPPHRPYLYGCMVLSFDGKMGFADSPEGTLVSKENRQDAPGALTDFWIMNVARAYADGVVMGTGTLKTRLHKLWCGDVADPDLVAARAGLGKNTPQPLSILASLDGRDVPLAAPLLDMQPAPVIITSLPGAAYLREHLGRPCQIVTEPGQLACPAGGIRLVAAGREWPDTAALLGLLRRAGLQYLSVEAPGYIWHLMHQGLLDEYLLNYSGVVAGGGVAMGATEPFTAAAHPHAQLLALGYHEGFIFTRQRLVYGR